MDLYLKSQDQKEQSPRFRASDMGRCFRMRYYKKQGEKQLPLDPRSRRIFAVGNNVHALYQAALEQIGVLVSKEEEINYRGILFGHYDALVNPEGKDAPHNGGADLILYDIKTVNSGKFHQNDKSKIPWSEIDTHYVKQIHAYCMILREQYPNLTDCRIYYVSKDDLDTREVPVPYLPRREEAVIKEIHELIEIESGKIPPATPKMEWECKFCPFRNICPTGKPIYEDQLREVSRKKIL